SWRDRGVQLGLGILGGFGCRRARGFGITADANGADLPWLIAPGAVGGLLIEVCAGDALLGRRDLGRVVGNQRRLGGRDRRAQCVIAGSPESTNEYRSGYAGEGQTHTTRRSRLPENGAFACRIARIRTGVVFRVGLPVRAVSRPKTRAPCRRTL